MAAAKTSARAANQRLVRALLLLLLLIVSLSLLVLWSLVPLQPDRGLAHEQLLHPRPLRRTLDRVPGLYDGLPAIQRPPPAGSCFPSAVNLSSLRPLHETAGASLVELYEALRDKASDLPPPPELRGDHQKLCNPAYHQSKQWGYCLPMRGLTKGSRCGNSSAWSWRALVDLAASGQAMDQGTSHLDGDADEEETEDVERERYTDEEAEHDKEAMEMLVYREYDEEEDPYREGAVDDVAVSQEEGVRSPCVYASVLHLLLVEVFDALRAHGLKPALLFGSMLGAVRDESVIPFTEDADVGFRQNLKKRLVMKKVKDELFARGYHVFKDDIYRVCVAPSHPLAGFLFDRSVSRRRKHHVPYVDLYPMTPEDEEARWAVDRTRDGRYRVERGDFEPYAKVRVNGAEFDTLANPHAFLLEEYGPDYLTPRPRA